MRRVADLMGMRWNSTIDSEGGRAMALNFPQLHAAYAQLPFYMVSFALLLGMQHDAFDYTSDKDSCLHAGPC